MLAVATLYERVREVLNICVSFSIFFVLEIGSGPIRGTLDGC